MSVDNLHLHKAAEVSSENSFHICVQRRRGIQKLIINLQFNVILLPKRFIYLHYLANSSTTKIVTVQIVYQKQITQIIEREINDL